MKSGIRHGAEDDAHTCVRVGVTGGPSSPA
jgi:hypothetical protein